MVVRGPALWSCSLVYKLLSVCPWSWSLFFLQCVSELIFHLSPELSPHLAREFSHVIGCAETYDPTFVVRKVHSARLVYYYHPV